MLQTLPPLPLPPSPQCLVATSLHRFAKLTRAVPPAALEQVQPLSPDIAWADQSMLTTHRGRG